MELANNQALIKSLHRVRIWYFLLMLVVGVFGIRLFYLQVIQYSHYKNVALNTQLKQYKIPASRGLIFAYDGNQAVPIVLNQELYTIYADPSFIKPKKVDQIITVLVERLGGKPADYRVGLTKDDTRYVELAEKVSQQDKKSILSHEFAGIGAKAHSYRVYPQGSLAAQVLGFVNANNEGSYGVEQALDDRLAGQPGMLKAITDINGVPLAASPENVLEPAQPGDDLHTTIDIGMQRQMEQILKDQYVETNSQGLSAIIMDPNTGAIKAMANYPTYNPEHYSQVDNYQVFQNPAVSRAIEPGSIIKPLTAAAALDQNVVQRNSTYYDPAHWLVDGYNITNIEEDGGARMQSMQTILSLSLNTGATWLLMQMSGGNNDITLNGISSWHNYLTDHFLFGQETGVEQGFESNGYIPPVDTGLPAIDLKFANTTFGQGLTVTATQMAAALSSVLNGGTYYQPSLVAGWRDSETGEFKKHHPVVLKKDVVDGQTSRAMVPLMENIVEHYHEGGFWYMDFSDDYIVGGKTGTAQVAKPNGGGYYDDVFNGTYMGFVGGNQPQYVIVVFNIKPDTPGYAGSYGGQPVFADLAHMLINHGYVTPKH